MGVEICLYESDDFFFGESEECMYVCNYLLRIGARGLGWNVDLM